MMLRRFFVLATAFAATAVALTPLRTAWASAGAPRGISVQHVSGTIWSGELSGVSWQGVDLGDFRSNADFLTRIGDMVVHLASDDGPVRSADISTSGALSNVSAEFQLSGFVAVAPAQAVVRISKGAAEFDQSACRIAAGTVSVDPVAQYGLPALTGELSCLSGEFVASLASADGAYSLSVVIGSDGARIMQANSRAVLVLIALGVDLPEARQ